MKKSIKCVIGIVLGVFVLVAVLAAYKALEHRFSKIETYDFVYLESEAPRLIQEYMNERELYVELSSCHVLVQNNHVFAFFDYKSLINHPILEDMPSDVVDRLLFYGYVRIEKRFHTYSIEDFGISNHDTMDSRGVSENESVRGSRYCYGKITNNNIYKIEFYNNDVLAGTYHVGDKDYYFMELAGSIGTINRRFYDKENHLLYEDRR